MKSRKVIENRVARLTIEALVALGEIDSKDETEWEERKNDPDVIAATKAAREREASESKKRKRGD